MLKILRKNTKIIIWIVIFSFALWGGYSLTASLQKKDRMAGEVFGRSVSFQEFNLFYQAAQIFRAGPGDSEPEDPEIIRERAWQNLIYARQAKKDKIEVTDDEVRSELQNILTSQGITTITPEIYQRWVKRTTRMEPPHFERMLREMIRIRKLLSGIASQALPEINPELARRAYAFENHRVLLDIVTFPSSDEALAFISRANDESSWNREAQSSAFPVEPTGDISLKDLVTQWGIPHEIAEKIPGSETGTISGPFASGNRHLVFRIMKQTPANESLFTEKLQSEYMARISSSVERQRFMIWHMELMSEAGLRDYTNQSHE